MLYAVVDLCSRQHLVELGKHYDVNHIRLGPGDKVNLMRILLLRKKEDKELLALRRKPKPVVVSGLIKANKPKENKEVLSLGKPLVVSGLIEATVLGHMRGKKNITYKMRSKKNSRKIISQRDLLTRVKIDSVFRIAHEYQLH